MEIKKGLKFKCAEFCYTGEIVKVNTTHIRIKTKSSLFPRLSEHFDTQRVSIHQAEQWFRSGFWEVIE